MPILLDTSSADFATAFASFLAMKREAAADVEAASRRIVEDVAARGDVALLEATQKFDRLDIDASRLRIGANEITQAVKACDRETLAALEFARERIDISTYYVQADDTGWRMARELAACVARGVRVAMDTLLHGNGHGRATGYRTTSPTEGETSHG